MLRRTVIDTTLENMKLMYLNADLLQKVTEGMQVMCRSAAHYIHKWIPAIAVKAACHILYSINGNSKQTHLAIKWGCLCIHLHTETFQSYHWIMPGIPQTVSLTLHTGDIVSKKTKDIVDGDCIWTSQCQAPVLTYSWCKWATGLTSKTSKLLPNSASGTRLPSTGLKWPTLWGQDLYGHAWQ